jgi:hypothetical protein
VERRFVESPVFSQDRERLERRGELSLEDLADLQQEIIRDPGRGDLVPGLAGVRKIRMRQRAVGRGKSGGARVLYLDFERTGVTYLLVLYAKREKVDLSPEEKRALRVLIEAVKREEEQHARKQEKAVKGVRKAQGRPRGRPRIPAG